MWTKEQENALTVAKTGHNLCIFGKSGSGKSTVIKEIYKTISLTKKRCKVVCPTGVACKIYDDLATTVHSFYGLQTAELPALLLVQRSLERQDIVEQIQSVDVLIWDEISMASLRIFHIVDRLHKKVRQNSLPFGGIQVILGGDFCQLNPIQGVLDSGDPVFKSAIFDKVFPHRIFLEKVTRQSETEEKFKKALDCLRLGVCDDETEEYIRRLSRSCVNRENSTCTPPIHIFFKKLPVDVHNSYMLSCLSEETLKYESTDTGRSGLLKDTVPEVLTLKRGCPVMLLFNINNTLTNGTCGKFLNADGTDSTNNSLLVHFPNVGEVIISRKTWYVYNKNGRVLASRTQFPLTLSYAITVHKAQSATLESAVVHCGQEFDAGQTYVALSRVRTEKSIQVIGFQKRFLLKQPEHIERIHTAQDGNPVPSFSCCRSAELGCANCELDHEDPLMDDEISNSHPADEDLTVNEEKYRRCFVANQGEKEDFNLIVQNMTQGKDDGSVRPSIIRKPPHFILKDFLESLTKDENTDSLSQSVKEAANYAIENLQIFELLTIILWNRIKQLFEGYFPKNAEEVHMSSSNFTQVTAKLNQMFLTNEYRSDIITAFNLETWSDMDSGKRTLGAQLLFHLYQIFVAEISKSIESHEDLQPYELKVSDMDPEGRGKIRYVGGWATRKLLQKCRKYVADNKNSTSQVVIRKVTKEMKKLSLLENNVIVSSEFMQETSEEPETLRVTESRQYRERGLLNISDPAYEFFMLLEQQCIDHVNSNRLDQLGTDLINDSIVSVTKNEVVQNAFNSLFCLEKAEDRVLVPELFTDLVIRYTRMGAGQFLRDFRKDYHLKKDLAHRKAVVQRKEKAKEREMKLHIAQIEQDKSQDKKLSHLQLRVLAGNLKTKGLKSLYNKKELQKLCDAYNVWFSSKWNKEKLACELAKAIDSNESTPSPHVLSRYRAVLVSEDQANKIPVLRIVRL